MTPVETARIPASRDDDGFTNRMRRCSVWLLTNAPSPYQAELFTAISAHDGVDLSVRFMRAASPSGRAVKSEFDSLTMFAPAPSRWRDEIRIHPRALWEAAFGRFDCYVLSGLYTSLTFLCCACILTVRRKPWVAWLERPRNPEASGSGRRSLTARWLRDRMRQFVLRVSSRVLCIGTAARDEYQQLGAAAGKLDVLPYCCDAERYDRVTDDDALAFRQEHQIAGCTVFLFSGQLIERKGVDTLLRAFEPLAIEDPSAVLLILGDGPQREALQSQVRQQPQQQVRFLGHLPQSQLPTVFRAADVFVFPSRHDGWGVVINEACAARLPVVASEETGAAHDLVDPGASGFRHPADDIAAFTESMKRLLEDPNLRRQMGERSRALVERYTPVRGAGQFAHSVRRAIG